MVGVVRSQRARLQATTVSEKYELATYSALGVDEVMRRLQELAVTHRGRRDQLDPSRISACLARDVAEARWRYEALRALNAATEDVRFLRALNDEVEASLRRARGGLTLEVEELGVLVLAGRAVEELVALVDGASPSALDETRPSDDDARAAKCGAVADAVREVPEGGWELDDAYFPELAARRREERAARRAVDAAIATGEFFEFEGRYVTTAARGQQPAGALVHGASRTGKTLYVEPVEVARTTNEWKAARSATKKAETAALGELTEAVREGLGALDICLDLAARVDAIAARASLGRARRWRVPELATRGAMRVRALRHALLDLDAPDESAGNDVILNESTKALVISGANAGGKTVLLKSIGLAAFLVKLGAPLPANGAEVGFFEPILAHVGDAQELGADSTYVAHLRAVDRALRTSTPGALCLLDELGSGTDPAQGAALGAAVLQDLVERGVRVVATTHHGQIKRLAATTTDFQVAAMAPGFRCELGVVGESRAIDAARRVPLPAHVVDRAVELLGDDAARFDRLARDLEEASASARLAEADARKAEASAREALQEAQEAAARAEREATLAEAKAAANYEARLVDFLAGRPEDNEVRREVEAARGKAQDSSARAIGLEPLDRIPPVGERVVVLKAGIGYRKTGRVAALAGVDTVKVRLDDVDPAVVKPLKLKARDLALASGSPRDDRRRGRQHKAAPRPGGLSRRAARALDDDVPSASVSPPANTATGQDDVVLRTSRNTLDLRGSTLERAQHQTDAFLHSAKAAGFRSAFVLHGHGTGVLKKGLRIWLKSQAIAKAFNPAKEGDGGDAFTEVHLS